MVQGDPNPSQVMQGAQLSELVQGLRASGLLRGYSHMLTGYIGSASFLRAVLDTVRVGSTLPRHPHPHPNTLTLHPNTTP